jgi:hypothetical protein
MLILFGGGDGARGWEYCQTGFYRKKKSYFRLPAIMHANKHIAEITPRLAFLVSAEAPELPIHRVQHATLSKND